jgi:serine/threonine protein kinase
MESTYFSNQKDINNQLDKLDNTYGVIDDKYSLIKKIGSGGTSSVYLGSFLARDQEEKLFAIKVIDPKKQDNKIFKNEVSMLQKVDNPNVVKIFDGGEGFLKKSNGKSKLVNYIVLEYIKNGELFDYIFFPGKGFGEEYGQLIFTHIISGLEACHKFGVVHRDLKTENIMVTEDFEIKIADFGFAANKQGKEGQGLLYTSLGTPSYAAPELHLKSPYYGVCNDIFALGVTMFVIVTGSMPFKAATIHDHFYILIAKNDYEGYWSKRNLKMNVSEEFKSLFFNMIAYEYTQRPSIDEIKEHPWIKKYKQHEQINQSHLTKEMSIIEKIKIDFSERKKIVDFKRHRERVQRENEKIGQRVTTGITRVYRSCDNIRQDNDMKFLEKDKNIILKDYVESSNPFTFIVKVKDRIKETDQNYTFECLNYEDYLINKAYLLINTFKDYFDNLNKKAEVKFIPDKFSIKIKIDEDEGNENENLEVDYNCYLTEESFSLKQMVFKELKFNVELQKYDEDKLIVEFKKKSGDRFELYTLFEDFINKISN